MGWFSSGSSGSSSSAGGTNWDKKKAEAGSKAKNKKDFGRGDWGKPETSGGSGGTMSDKDLTDNGF